jgi:hypothetical protein
LPSPALVIASIALIMAVGGGSFALAISDRKSDKRIAKRVANRQITRRAPHLSVNHANTANTADTANHAYATFHDNGISMPDSLTAAGNPIATLNIPTAGAYVISAKLEAFDSSSTLNMTSGQCQLAAGGDVDNQFFDATASATDDQEDVSLLVVHNFTSPGSVTLSCTDFGTAPGLAFFTKIAATQVANLSNAGF